MIAFFIFLVVLAALASVLCLSHFFISIMKGREPSYLMLFLGCVNLFFTIYDSFVLAHLLTEV